MPWKILLYWIYFLHSGFLSTCACPENRVALEFFTVLNILFTFRIFEQVALALKSRGCPEFTVLNVDFLYSGFLSNLRLPWKTELPWNFSLSWNIFHYSGFLSNLRLPWKQSLPWNFSSPGGGRPPRPPASYAYASLNVVVRLRHSVYPNTRT